MACVKDDGSLTGSAKTILETIRENYLTVEDISKAANMPLFKIRSSIRDMKSMGFVLEENETYKMNPKVEKLIERS